jgi:hypothetical protein
VGWCSQRTKLQEELRRSIILRGSKRGKRQLAAQYPMDDLMLDDIPRPLWIRNKETFKTIPAHSTGDFLMVHDFIRVFRWVRTVLPHVILRQRRVSSLPVHVLRLAARPCT